MAAPRFNRSDLRPAHYPARCTGLRSCGHRRGAFAEYRYVERPLAAPGPCSHFRRHRRFSAAGRYTHAIKLLGALQVPFVAIPGNHDRRALVRETFPDPTYGMADSALNTVRRIGGLDIFLIDSTVTGAAHGELDAPTLTWLDGTLGASTTRPAFLFLHHPPFDTGIVYTDAARLRNADALAAVLRRHPRALLIAAGHVHRAAQTVFAGISASICPAGEQAVTLEFEPRWPEVFRIDPPAFHLHAWLPGPGFGSVVTHLVPVGEFPGP